MWWTKSDDLTLIEQLQKETGITLKRVPLEGIGSYKVNGFAADDDGAVRGLAICDKKLLRLPALLSKFQRLEKLVLMLNQISDISSLKELKGLTYLNLYENQISDISSIKELKGLTNLDLTSNRISEISSLKKLKGLKELYLFNNKISDISSLKELKNLKKLYLYDNKITHMPAEFLDLGLAIKWNYDGKDEGIYLEGNPLESPPVEIIKKGNEAIRQYFKSLEGEKQALRQHPSDKLAKELFFISYSRKDGDFVLPLCKKLKEAGVEIWLDQWDIAPGDNWDKSIDDAIYKCTKMLSILSPDAVDSDQVRGELYTFCEEKKPVIPIVYRDCRIPRILKAIQYMNFTSSDLEDKTKIAELVKIITK
ncbi:MAG TPA: TIR domain-containing protein [Candidatus Deferrimicrobium sp.]|nr:TIR domain-containing protein [Candidatus Kapabacteria bacterium]HLP59173.1 TIR domain-containing protein [Candidatus Deferrimicrobium sp.]